MLTQWREQLISGNEDFDSLHDELFGKVKAFMDAAKRREGEQELARFFWFLQRYVRKIFATEEELQRTLGFSGYEAHKREHDEFAAKVRELVRHHVQWGASTALVVASLQLIAEWFRNHVNIRDREVSVFLRQLP